MFQNWTVKNNCCLQNNKSQSRSLFPQNTYSGRFSLHHSLFLWWVLISSLALYLSHWGLLWCLGAAGSPRPPELGHLPSLLVVGGGTEGSTTNNMHVNLCKYNHVFAGLDCIIILLTQDHLMEEQETFHCIWGINPWLFQGSQTRRVFIFVCARCLFWIFVIYPAPHLGLEQLREKPGCVYFFIAHGAEPWGCSPWTGTAYEGMTDRLQ